MVEGVDLSQPASVSWWPEGEYPEGPSHTRPFETLRDAIIFVHGYLKESERRTASINFGSPPHLLDYRDPDVRGKAAELGVDLSVLEVIVDEDAGEIIVKLPGTRSYAALFRKSADRGDLVPTLPAVEDENAPMPLEEFHSRAFTVAIDEARKRGWN
jgi:hypothetical protein